MSLILTSSEVMQILTMDLALAAAWEAFTAYGEGRVNMPPKAYLNLAAGDFRAMYGEIFLKRGHVCGLKWVNVHPENPKRGLLTVMAKIILNDPETGLEWADMDGTHITNFRTGAAGGVAAEVLSRPDARRLGVIGAGQQARTQIAAVLKVRPIEEVIICDCAHKQALTLKEEVQAAYGVKTRLEPTPQETALASDILVTATPSRIPLVERRWVKPGTHINAIGADAAGKQELDPDILKAAKIVVDDWAQASHSGEINVPLSRGDITPEQVYGSLGEVVAGRKPGRQSAEEITVFDSTGLIIQDLSLGFEVYLEARKRGLGEMKDFLKIT
ncbi:MAG: ornithine cyclodeaminase family protein [Deltaproteobacteria bacterium]|nr:ornithine cyclodeaminase family protein [Deltaproteobacteria bacterium]